MRSAAASSEPPVISMRPCPRSIQAPTGIEHRPATSRPADKAPNMALRDQPKLLRHRHDEQRKGIVDQAPRDELAETRASREWSTGAFATLAPPRPSP